MEETSFDAERPRLISLAVRILGSRTDADDIVQEAYLKAFRSFRSFQLGTNFRAWLYCILRNTFLSSRNSLAAGSMISLDSDEEGPDLAVENETPESILMKHVNSQQVQRAIEDLPNIYKETLLLCDVERMSYREISEILSILIATVMSRLARGRKALRDSLRGIEHTDKLASDRDRRDGNCTYVDLSCPPPPSAIRTS